MADNSSDYGNYTSTPNQDTVSYLNPDAGSSKMTTKKLSIGGLSKISSKTGRQGKQSEGLETP